MRVFFNRTNTNFGDHLNAWLWDRLVPDLLAATDERVLVGVGSLLKADLERVPGEKLIFGTGSGYGQPPARDVAARWRVYAVRGPLTAAQYGFAPETAITDGAWLVNLLPEYADLVAARSGTVFIPHWTSAGLGNWPDVAGAAGFDYIDPLDDGPSVLARIAGAELAVVESLHGAIFADYFRTPWIAVSSRTRVLHYKWLDWCQSLDLDYRTLPLPPSDAADFLTQGGRPDRAMPDLVEKRFAADKFLYAPVAAGDASRAYRMKMRLKARLRPLRDRALMALRARRNAGPLKRWNANYRDDLAGYLQRLAKAEPSLSDDAMRARRLDQLNTAFERFRAEQSV